MKEVSNRLWYVDKGYFKELYVFLFSKWLQSSIWSDKISREILFLLIIALKYNLKLKNRVISFKNRYDLVESIALDYIRLRKDVNELYRHLPMEALVCYTLQKKGVFFEEIYDIYRHHIKIKDLLPSDQFDIDLLNRTHISIKIGTPIFSKMEGNGDIHSSLLLTLFDEDRGVTFVCSMFMGRESLMISSLHYRKYNTNIPLHRIGLCFCYMLAKKLEYDKMYGFTNKNHPCAYHEAFKWLYDEYYESFGFQKNKNEYYQFDITWKQIQQKYKKYEYIFTWYIDGLTNHIHL